MTFDVSLIVGGADVDETSAALSQTLHSLEIADSLAASKGTWVMFVDDVAMLDRHACKNLLLAAEVERANLAMAGAPSDREVLTAGELQSRFASLDVDGLLINREWLRSLPSLANELAAGARTLPTSALETEERVVVIPQRVFTRPMPAVVDGSKALVHAGPVSRLAGIAFSVARLLPMSNRVLVDVDGSRPIDSAFAYLTQQWQAQSTPVRLTVVTPLTRNSWRHAWQLGRARWLISNERFISRLPKRKGQIHVMAVSETPLVRIGRDNPDWVLQPTSERRPSRAQVERWDQAITSSPYATEVLRSSSGYVGPVIQGQSLFADAIAVASAQPGLRERLGLDPLLPFVLIALRDARTLIPVELLSGTFRAGMQFAVVTDEGLAPQAAGTHARPVLSDAPSWFAAADVMITDWSSLAMEYAGLRRPIIAFRPDTLDIVRRRGTYLDLAEVWPGSCVTSDDQLVALLEQWREGGDQGLAEFAAHSTEFALLGSRTSGEAANQLRAALDSAL